MFSNVLRVCGAVLLTAFMVPGLNAQVVLKNQATADYSDPSGVEITTVTSEITNELAPLIDPFGQIIGCDGEQLTDYRGFTTGLYTTPNGRDLGSLLSLTVTETPDNPDNTVPAGFLPNGQNANPYELTNEGRYNFLLDPNNGQVDVGDAYILVVNPAQGSGLSQRRILIRVTNRTPTNVSYSATALDGQGIAKTGSDATTTGTLQISDGAALALVIAFTGLDICVNEGQAVQITKTGDRAEAEPGDTVVYRVAVTNLLNSGVLNDPVITDQLPLGFKLLPDSVRGELSGKNVKIRTEQSGQTVTFLPSAAIPPRETLTIVYASLITPNSLRGTGQNTAVVEAEGPTGPAQAGPVVYTLRLKPGILNSGGTIIGRVFVDQNFDGEQQSGELGFANAVILLDDGTRITTDPKGLFSVPNVLSGSRTGVLDLSSISGYTLAPNQVFIERNSQSRLVHLAPGGLVRMNFAITPLRGVQP